MKRLLLITCFLLLFCIPTIAANANDVPQDPKLFLGSQELNDEALSQISGDWSFTSAVCSVVSAVASNTILSYSQAKTNVAAAAVGGLVGYTVADRFSVQPKSTADKVGAVVVSAVVGCVTGSVVAISSYASRLF